MQNPFSLSFGTKPAEQISRTLQINEIIEDFNSDLPSSYVYMITGVRGSGKTVAMTTISSELAEDSSWITIELNPERDLLQGFASKLYSRANLKPFFLDAKLDFSALGIGFSISGGNQFFDIEDAISQMLKIVKMQNKKVLVTIDEVTNTKDIRIFVSAFQILIRNNLPIFLLMTGLYENIYDLQNSKTMTFLYRAPKVFLSPLNMTAIRNRYADIFEISADEAWSMAVLTKGYPFAFQVLGFIKWKNKTASLDDLLPTFDEYLDEYVYEKIWNELSEKDRNVISIISELTSNENKISVKDIRDKCEMTSNIFSTYRDRLMRKGIIDTSQYGYISLVLPRFADFVERYYN